MKRLIVSITIIGIIIVVGIFAVVSVNSKNQRLYGHIEAVLAEYNGGGDPLGEISKLESYFEGSYSACLSYFVNDDDLQEIAIMISKLKPMFDSDCDEFSAECESIRAAARKIYLGELPSFDRIL